MTAGSAPHFPPCHLQAVVFDYGGTLATFHRQPVHLARVRDSFAPDVSEIARIPIAEAARRMATVEETMQEVEPDAENDESYLQSYASAWRQWAVELPESLVYAIVSAEQKCCDRTVRLSDGAHVALDRLRSRHIKTGICSNTAYPPEFMARQLDVLELSALIDVTIWSSAVGSRKPASAIYAETVKLLGCTPDNVLFVGDSLLEDYVGPTEFGMRAALFTGNAASKPAATIPTISHLLDIERLL